MLTKFAEIAGILTLVVTVYAFLESSNRLPEQIKLPAPIQPETYFYIIVFLLAATLLGRGSIGQSCHFAVLPSGPWSPGVLRWTRQAVRSGSEPAHQNRAWREVSR
jgi:hypothetical protein